MMCGRRMLKKMLEDFSFVEEYRFYLRRKENDDQSVEIVYEREIDGLILRLGVHKYWRISKPIENKIYAFLYDTSKICEYTTFSPVLSVTKVHHRYESKNLFDGITLIGKDYDAQKYQAISIIKEKLQTQI